MVHAKVTVGTVVLGVATSESTAGANTAERRYRMREGGWERGEREEEREREGEGGKGREEEREREREREKCGGGKPIIMHKYRKQTCSHCEAYFLLQ